MAATDRRSSKLVAEQAVFFPSNCSPRSLSCLAETTVPPEEHGVFPGLVRAVHADERLAGIDDFLRVGLTEPVVHQARR